jgi:hypothetical protein
MGQFAGLDGLTLAVAVPQRDPQRGEDQVGASVGGGLPADDPLGEHVDDERDVDEPGPAPDIGEVGDPAGVGCRCGEIAVEQVAGAQVTPARDGGPDLLARRIPVRPSSRIRRSTVQKATSSPRRRR